MFRPGSVNSLASWTRAGAGAQIWAVFFLQCRNQMLIEREGRTAAKIICMFLQEEQVSVITVPQFYVKLN